MKDDLLAGLVFAFWAALFGAFAGVFLLWGNGTTPFVRAAVTGAIVAAGAVMLLSAVIGAVNSQQTAARRKTTARENTARDAREKVERRKSEERQLVTNATLAVNAFEGLPAHLQSAEDDARRAETFFGDGAFSPFWSAIESAYAHLGEYTAAVRLIDAKASAHGQNVIRLVQAGGNPGELASFPVRLDTAHTQRVLAEATGDLSNMVYEAQRVPVFAQIWEQRRTTAAVIAGFANLEQAVARMSSSVTNALGFLDTSLTESGREVQAQLGKISAGASSASQEQIALMSSLNRRADDIRVEVYHQNWGHYPLH